MASIRKRGNSYLLVVSMGYDPEGHRLKPQQKTVHPPENLTPKAKEKWLEEEAALFEWQCRNEPLPVDKSITLAAYTAYWLAHIAPGKLPAQVLRGLHLPGWPTSPLGSWRNRPWPGTSRTLTDSCPPWAATSSPT